MADEPVMPDNKEEDGLHISDVDLELRQRVADEVSRVVDEHASKFNLSVEVEEVSVVGSFARGEANPQESDLDLVIVVSCDAEIPWEDEQFTYQLKRNILGLVVDISPEVDAVIPFTAIEPFFDEPPVETEDEEPKPLV